MDDPQAVADALENFIDDYQEEFHEIPKRHSHLLEIGAVSLCCHHYESQGISPVPRNLQDGYFRVRLGSRGYRENFSWFEFSSNGRHWEIHTNANVLGGWGHRARYCLDIGIVDKGAEWRDGDGRSETTNENLITWAEAKSLTVYPMLLAQFIGIVHEVTPRFLNGSRPWGFIKDSHFDPALICEGHLTATARNAVSGFQERGYKINILNDSPQAIVELSNGMNVQSPFSTP